MLRFGGINKEGSNNRKRMIGLLTQTTAVTVTSSAYRARERERAARRSLPLDIPSYSHTLGRGD